MKEYRGYTILAYIVHIILRLLGKCECHSICTTMDVLKLIHLNYVNLKDAFASCVRTFHLGETKISVTNVSIIVQG